MPTLPLANVKVGSPQLPKSWDSSRQDYVELDPLQHFLRQLEISDKNVKLRFRDCNIDGGNIEGGRSYHKNYLKYLENCWADHLGVVITPDIVWYTLLAELAACTKAAPDQYRHLFTTTDETPEIVISQGDPVVMSLSTLTEKLKDRVPTNDDLFFPEFTTSCLRSMHAFQAAFCDMCSPYYNYAILCCGFPAIDVRGTPDDYALMLEKWSELSKLFVGQTEWCSRVRKILKNCHKNYSSADWWRKMFTLKNCGSGHQVEVYGWFADLFRSKPALRYSENFTSGVSVVDYTQLNTGKHYRMLVGLFMSRMKGDYLVPDFGYSVFEKI